MAAECAGEQGDYWAMHNWLFNNQGVWKFKPTARETITQAASKLGKRAAKLRHSQGTAG